MSERRRARAGMEIRAQRRDGLPAPLRDRHDPFWTDPAAVSDAAGRHRLTLRFRPWRSVRDAPWWARFDAFRAAWCESKGLMSHQWPNTPDWRRIRDAGIDGSSSSRYRLAPP